MAHELSDEGERAMLERIATTERATAFREFVCEQVPVAPGDRVLSVGCGPGFETSALAERAADGAVHGLDLNPAVLAAARERCGSSCEFVRGDATALPVRDGAYDLAVAVQMLQFLDDPAAAIAELCRVVRPGGRVAVTTGAEGSGAMHTPTELLKRAREVSREAAGGRGPGTRLSSLLPEAGLVVEDVVPRAEIRTEIDDQVERGIEVRRAALARSGEFDDDEVDAWERQLRDLDADEQFLTCGTKLLYVARKPE